MSLGRQKKGKIGMQRAQAWLEAQGYEVEGSYLRPKRNSGAGEVDFLVSKSWKTGFWNSKKQYWIVEVKYRSLPKTAGAFDGQWLLGNSQRKRLRIAQLIWSAELKSPVILALLWVNGSSGGITFLENPC